MTNEQLEQWIDDLQSGMYINCVYCGHRYGPNSGPSTKKFNITMRKALEEHISSCPKHPLSAAKDEIATLKEQVKELEVTLDLIHDADMRAIKMWQEAHPDKENMWPDQAMMVCWLMERVRELEAERNLLKSDLDKVERGYDEVSQRRDETVAMCDYLQNQVKDLENILEQESRMVKAFMSELDKNQDENEFLHGRISELEAKNKRLQSELNKWTRPYDNADLQVMKEQSDSKSLAAQQAYINALDWHYRHEQAENNWLGWEEGK